jgi:hypothetical protein
MNTSGLVLDLYDDEGAQLKTWFPSKSDLPDFVKSAAVLGNRELKQVPDDLFALVIQTEGQDLRKYACYDAGNTAISTLYFLANAHKMPANMQKVAASNLITACQWYSLDVPDELQKLASGAFEKVAIGLSTALNLATAPSVIKGTAHEVKRNMASVDQAQRVLGTPIVTPEEMKQFKFAEAAGTHTMPLSAPSDKSLPSKFVPRKTASAVLFTPSKMRAKHKEVAPDVNEHINCHSTRLNPYVSSKGEAPKEKMAQAGYYALRDRYPLNTPHQIKAAAQYFLEFGTSMSPSDRHTYCHNLTKRASALYMDVPADIEKLGSVQYAPQDELDAAIASRHLVIQDPELHSLLDKIAEYRPWLTPDEYCGTLEEFDKVACIRKYWDRVVFDPSASTYGVKLAAEFSDEIDNQFVDAAHLRALANQPHSKLTDIFGADFTDEFRKDPIDIYKSMPREQQLVIIHMAREA